MKKFGFTLAEVLITLGIIGVISAITLPILFDNYKKYVWVNQLKSNYSILSRGFSKMLADEGVDSLWDIEAFNLIKNPPGNLSGCHCGSETSLECKDFYPYLKKYFSIISINNDNYSYKTSDNSSEYTSSSYKIQLKNGAFLLFYNFYVPKNINRGYCNAIHKKVGGYGCAIAASISIDINGNKKPNIYGRDIFKFYVTDTGKVEPQGTYNYVMLNYYVEPGLIPVDVITKEIVNQSYTPQTRGAAYIIQNGWKMDY